MKMLMVLAAAAAFLMLGNGPASAHGDAQWIMDDPVTYRCCGPRDCFIMEMQEVEHRSDGWYVRGMKVPDNSVYPVQAPDPHGASHYWACFYTVTGKPRCLFVPVLF